ncbi:MAG: hypothetical protein IT285_11860 [Bdellovibrionales bacterium]|nr:hypothetical protein [Bdellovibrionales bacterium]
MSRGTSLLIALTLLASIGTVARAALGAADAPLRAGVAWGACTPAERWEFGRELRAEWSEAYGSFLKGGLSPLRGFAEALALRGLPGTPAEKAFSEFWIARALQQGGLLHLAHGGFMALALKNPAETDPGVQLAALDCAATLTHRYPSLELDPRLIDRLPFLAKRAPLASVVPVVHRAAVLLAVQELSRTEPQQIRLQVLSQALEGAGPHEDLILGLAAARARRHVDAIERLSRFTSGKTTPQFLGKFRDLAHLTRGRAHYAMGSYASAARAYQQVSKSSNDLKSALNELSWAQLQGDDLGGSIGTAINLQTGFLRRTFAPEAPMVMAMALNELCQFPESIRSINTYRSRYLSSYQWLRAHRKETDYHSLAIRFMKRDASVGVPEPVASEWIRSPLFIARQDGVNLLYKEKQAQEALTQAAATEQSRMASELLNRTKDLKARYLKARIRLKPGQEIPGSLNLELAALLREVTHYRRLKRAAPVWKDVLAAQNRRAPDLRGRLVAQIDADLERMSRRMLRTLEDVAETTELIEVEIFNGASQDLIWQNAHPDYQAVAKEIQKRATRAAADRSLNWGTVQTGLDSEGEVWEDELGSFNANMLDNCSSKEKYLALRRAQLSALEN